MVAFHQFCGYQTFPLSQTSWYISDDLYLFRLRIALKPLASLSYWKEGTGAWELFGILFPVMLVGPATSVMTIRPFLQRRLYPASSNTDYQINHRTIKMFPPWLLFLLFIFFFTFWSRPHIGFQFWAACELRWVKKIHSASSGSYEKESSRQKCKENYS